MTIPENLTEFLYWVKERTELYWAKNPTEITYDDEEIENQLFGAKWIGLNDSEIDKIEIKHNIKFTPDHREFLRILHTLDRKYIITDPEQFPEGTTVFYKESSFFYDWLSDNQEIKNALNWPFRTIFEDIVGKNGVWLKSWGNRVESDEEREEVFSKWYSQAPKLLPLTRHRFLVSEPNEINNPVLSVWGSDIIVYGWNLRSYILNELTTELELLEEVYDEDDDGILTIDGVEFIKPKEWYFVRISEVDEIIKNDFALAVNKDIPFWKEMILYWSRDEFSTLA